MRRSISSGEHTPNNVPSKRQNIISVQLTPIPGSPYTSDASKVSKSPSLSSKHSSSSIRNESNRSLSVPKEKDSPRRTEQSLDYHSHPPESISRARSKSYTSHRLQPPQSLDAALEILSSQSDRGHGQKSFTDDWATSHSSLDEIPVTPRSGSPRDIPPSPSRPIPDTPIHRPTVGGKCISSPIINHGIHHIADSFLHSLILFTAATLQMSPVKNRAAGKPVLVEPQIHSSIPNASITTLSSG